MTLPRPCLGCGDPIPSGSRCPDCKLPRHHKTRSAEHSKRYGYHHRRLSEQARRLQPFCSVCGTPDNLELDHTPAAWAKVDSGKRLTLRDFKDGLLDVLCHYHNVQARAARGSNVTRPNRNSV